MAGSRPARNPRRGLLPALLCLPLLFGPASPADAQTTPSISPSTLIENAVRGNFGTTVTVSNIPSDWVTPVNHALTTTGTGTGHATIATSTCSLEDAFNTSLDTYDVCAGTNGAGYNSNNNSYQIEIRAGLDSHSDSGETFTVTLTDSSTPANTLSFTMTINDPPVRIGVSLPDQEGVSRVDGKQLQEESTGSVAFPLSANEPLANDLTVCVRVSESGGDRVASGSEGIQTATLLASGTSNGSGSYTVTWTDTPADDPDSTIIVRVEPPNTLGCTADNDSYAVSADDPSDQILIQDDEDTTVSLTSTDMTMTEGDASDTATLTISLSRRLYAGETIGVPIALASTTGARLPGSVDGGSTANHDFTVGAAAGSGHSGVTLTGALTANPRVVFTGHDSNTVQTATVTLTPVANRDDPDAAHETITATLSSLGLLDTTVSGVAAHGTNSAATLTLEDDEAAPAACPAQNNNLSVGSIRVLENGGMATYCVRLTTAPSGGDTTVTITNTGSYQASVTFSPSSLTFTASDYQTPQQVTVTGVDQPNLHFNRNTRLTNTANGGGYSNQNLGNVQVEVDDAPELEAWDLAVWAHTVLDKGDLDNPDPSKRRPLIVRADRDAVKHPSTVKKTGGFRYFQNDMVPIAPLRYQLRLSNRPATGETVTVTAESSDFDKFGLSLTPGGTPQRSLTVTFEDRNADPVCFNGGHGTFYGGNTPSTATSWQCYRRIWIISTQSKSNQNARKGCADITHTATGGGLRSTTIGTIRAHAVAGFHVRSDAPGSDCPFITSQLRTSTNAPAKAAPAPTEAVANVQVTAVDDTSASVTWDAVEHATSYDVSWSAESSDSLNASAGDLPGVTGTTTTIDHGASVPMTLTVTVTPEYVDKNSDTQQLANLAGTATLAVGPGSDALSASAQAEAVCVSDALLADAREYAGETWRTSPDHVERWSRVLAAYGVDNAYSSNPMTVAEAKAQADRGLQRWVPVVPALECLDKEPAAAEVQAQAEAQQAVPAITVTAGAGVTEGAAAGFTLKADPVPAEEIEVTVSIAQTGAVADASALGERTVTIPAGKAEAAFAVATAADETDEPSGTVTATAADGAGYTVSGQGASVTVADDDATQVTLTASQVDLSESSGTGTLTLTLGRVLVEGESLSVALSFAGTATLGTDYELAAPSTAPAGVSYANLSGSDPARVPTVTFAGPAGGESAASATLELSALADSLGEGEGETVSVKVGSLSATGLGGGAEASGSTVLAIVEPPPEISIAADSQSVAEGDDAGFTVTASRAPGTDLTVRVTVSESGDFVASDDEGSATVVIAEGETEAAFSVPTVNDAVQESGGTVTAALADGGPAYEVAAAPDDSASVNVTDDDAPAAVPTLSVADVSAKEDVGLMFFAISLDRPASDPVKVTFTARDSDPVSARQGEDYYWWWPEGLRITFHPGQTEKRMWVYVYNDNHDEDPETFEVALSRPSGGAAIGDGVAVGTIVNSDPMPAAWLTRFGRTAAQQALDAVTGRIAAPRDAGIHGSVAGQPVSFGPAAQSGFDGASAAAAQDQSLDALHSHSVAGVPADERYAGGGFVAGSGHTYSMTAREALLASSFAATGQADTAGGTLALWGRAAHSDFDGREGDFALDGDAATAMVGADYVADGWLVGMALMRTDGEGGYRDTDPEDDVCVALPGTGQDNAQCRAVRGGDGRVEATLTSAVPYGSLQVSEGLKVWGALGYGTGKVTLKPDTDEARELEADISWTMAAGGLRGDVMSPGGGSGLSIAVVSDALWARTGSDKTRELASSDSHVTRLRLGLEGSWRTALDQGGHFTPRFEIGARHDGGDAETGFGLELGGGLSWSDPVMGLSLELSGRTLAVHGSEDLKDRGFAATVSWDPDPATRRGASLTLTQERGGQAQGGLDALFAPQALDARATGADAPVRWRAEAAYGYAVPGGRVIAGPHAGLGLSPGNRQYTLGWRVTPARGAPDVSFGVSATRTESDTLAPQHSVGFEAVARW